MREGKLCWRKKCDTYLEPFCNWKYKVLIHTAILVSPSPILTELLSQSWKGEREGEEGKEKHAAALKRDSPSRAQGVELEPCALV